MVPSYRAGSTIDGSKMVHAAVIYRGSARSPKLPFIDKSKPALLSYTGEGEQWQLSSGGEDSNLLQTYSTDDLRSSVVYRARCFKDQTEAAQYNSKPLGGPSIMTLEQILRTFAEDMVKRGLVATVEGALGMDRLKFALLILQTYTKYPMPAVDVALLPYNYCALGRLASWTQPIIDFLHICEH